MLGKDKVLCKTNSVQSKHNLYYKRIFRCIRSPAKNQMTFNLQTILVQDQTFHFCNHVQEVITKDCRRYIPGHDLCKSLSFVVCEILPADHALTGCDTTSSFFGIGKNSMFKALKEPPNQLSDLRTCCLNVSSLGGSLTKVESLTVSNFTRNLFRSIWHRFDFPFGSYSLDISFRLRSTESFMPYRSEQIAGKIRNCQRFYFGETSSE
jgi:hypothetical protein